MKYPWFTHSLKKIITAERSSHLHTRWSNKPFRFCRSIAPKMTAKHYYWPVTDVGWRPTKEGSRCSWHALLALQLWGGGLAVQEPTSFPSCRTATGQAIHLADPMEYWLSCFRQTACLICINPRWGCTTAVSHAGEALGTQVKAEEVWDWCFQWQLFLFFNP